MRSKILRQQQDLNLRGQSPSDFKSDSLTTRTCCRRLFQVLRIGQKDHTPGGTRTRNPQIRSLMRYPLRHWGSDVPCVEPGLHVRDLSQTPWRNGSASDSRPEGWGFESLWGQFLKKKQKKTWKMRFTHFDSFYTMAAPPQVDSTACDAAPPVAAWPSG